MTRTKTIIADLQAANMALLRLVSDIRAAVGDPEGKLMQDELVERVRSIKAEADRIAVLPKPAALPFAIFDQELADLRRFHECGMDGEGYDVPKDRMKRLAEIGLVRRVSANYYEHTDFGLSVLNGDFDTAPQPDYKAQRDALLSDVERCYRMLLSEPDTKGALFKAENILREAIAAAKGGV